MRPPDDAPPRPTAPLSAALSGIVERFDRFAVVLRQLRRRLPNASIGVVALPNELESARQVAAAADAAAVIPTVRQLFALVGTSDLLITPDTAVAHIASAFGRPTLTLLRRRAEYHIWVPYRTPGRNVFGDEELTIEGLPAERVIAALDSFIDEFAPEVRGTVRPRARASVG